MTTALRNVLLLVTLALSAWVPPAAAQPTASPSQTAKRPPSIIIILADDMGYGDLGVYGNKEIPTPNIDALAAAGVRFTDGYVTCPICAPTRAALLSGRYQQRFGFETNPGPAQQASDKFGLPRSERTLAEKMKEAGYANGMFGKWHLGYKDELQPQQRGFDEFFGFLSGAHTYMPGEGRGRRGGGYNEGIVRNGKPVEEKEYLTEAFAREAAAFIGKHSGAGAAGSSTPYFVYLPFNAVHGPMEATQKYRDRFPQIKDDNRRTFAGMLSALDDAVGRVMAAVKESGQEENTLVFFFSDNGGPTPQTTASNLPLRGYKTQVLEGGIRVPFIMKWPGHVPAGKVYAQPVVSMDIHATALAAAGWKEPFATGGAKNDAKPLDGRDLLPFVGAKVDGAATANAGPHEALFWRMGNQWAVRKGDWKLVSQGGGGGRRGGNAGGAGGAGGQLFNLREDIGETNDLAAKMPEKVAELRKAYDEWNAKNIAPMWRRSEGAGDDDDGGAAGAGGAGGGRGRSAAQVRSTFESLDTDKDGFLTEAEYAMAPPAAAPRSFAQIDSNKDAKLSLEEVTAAFAGGRQQRRRPGGI
jgi:arylsulfatase A-like enzyme